MSGPYDAMRCSDADRDRAASVLTAAFAEGRLDAAEHAARLDAVLAARTYGELSRLIGDLPVGSAPPAGAARPAGPAAGRTYYRPSYPVRHTNGLAKVALVLSILTPFTGGLGAIGAIVAGHSSLAQIRRSGEDGRGLATAGLAIGYAWVIGFTLIVLVAVLGLLTL